MKRLLMLLLLIAFAFSITACGLINNNASEGTQQDNAAWNETSGGDAAADGQDSGNPTGDDSPAAVEDGEDSSSSNVKTVKVTLYFPTEDNSALKKEEREVEVVDGAILKACVLALAAGPTAEGLRNPIPEGTVLRGISIKDRVATVDFSKEFLNTNGLGEVTTRLSVVNTLTEIDGVDKVHLHIDGEDMIGPSGLPLGDMKPAILDDDGKPVAGEIKTVTLYFSDDNAMYLKGEKREVSVAENDSLEEVVILELIKGPVSEHLWGAIPDGTRLLSVSTGNGLCTVNFSGEFVDNSPGGTASERMAIYSVVNTLTELDGIEKVQFLIDGEKREIYTHAVFDKPFSRDESIIGK